MTTINSVSMSDKDRAFMLFDEPKASLSQKFYEVLTEGLDCGSFVADLADSMKLTSFYSAYISGGEASPASVRITEAGGVIKNFIEAAEFPRRVGKVYETAQNLASETVQSVAEFGASVLIAGASLFEGADLGSKVGLVGKEVVAFLEPLDSAGAAAFGLQETGKNVYNIYENSGAKGDSSQISFSLIKLVRSVAFAAVGALGLSALFFKAAFSPLIVPFLLTGAVASSVASRFFEGLVLSGRSASGAITV